MSESCRIVTFADFCVTSPLLSLLSGIGPLSLPALVFWTRITWDSSSRRWNNTGFLLPRGYAKWDSWSPAGGQCAKLTKVTKSGDKAGVRAGLTNSETGVSGHGFPGAGRVLWQASQEQEEYSGQGSAGGDVAGLLVTVRVRWWCVPGWCTRAGTPGSSRPRYTTLATLPYYPALRLATGATSAPRV